jgi:hypothetical protein
MNRARLVARRLHAVVGRGLSHRPKRHSPHCRPPFHGTMRSRPSISVALLEPHRIATADRTSLKHRSVHPHVDLVVLSRGTQDARSPGEIPPQARVAITHRGQGPCRAPLIEVSWLVCQYSTRSLVSTEKHETTPETGIKGRGGHTAGVGTVTVVMGGYYPLPRSLTAINRPANSARVLRSRTCRRLYAYDAPLEWLPQDLQDVAAELR